MGQRQQMWEAPEPVFSKGEASFFTDENEGRNELAFDVEKSSRQQRLLELMISTLGTDFKGNYSWIFQPGNYP